MTIAAIWQVYRLLQNSIIAGVICTTICCSNRHASYSQRILTGIGTKISDKLCRLHCLSRRKKNNHVDLFVITLWTINPVGVFRPCTGSLLDHLILFLASSYVTNINRICAYPSGPGLFPQHPNPCNLKKKKKIFFSSTVIVIKCIIV